MQEEELYHTAAEQTVEAANLLAEQNADGDVRDIADGLLAGAIHYWLYSRQPCSEPMCEDCAPLTTAQGRCAELQRFVAELAAESDYYHTPNDSNVGRA